MVLSLCLFLSLPEMFSPSTVPPLSLPPPSLPLPPDFARVALTLVVALAFFCSLFGLPTNLASSASASSCGFAWSGSLRRPIRRSVDSPFALHVIKENFPTDRNFNPYTLLGLSRDATESDVKQAYRKLSRKYHQDAMINVDVLPGDCDDLDAVRDKWEDIKLAREVLMDKTQRLRWDRKNFIIDPTGAAGRTFLGLAEKGLDLVGDRLFAGASYVLDQVVEREGGDKVTGKANQKVEEKKMPATFDWEKSNAAQRSKVLPPKKLSRRQKKRGARKGYWSIRCVVARVSVVVVVVCCFLCCFVRLLAFPRRLSLTPSHTRARVFQWCVR